MLLHQGPRVLSLTVLSILSLGLVSHANAAVDAPGFQVGPRVVGAGLLWSGTKGVSLSTATGTRLLVPGADLSAVRVEDGWTVLAEPTGLEAGRIGGRLVAVRALRRCVPGTRERWLDALAKGELYTVVRASCVGRHPGRAQFLVRVRPSGGTVEAIARVSSGAISLAAAGRLVALTYQTSGESGVRVEVFDSASAKRLYSLTTPRGGVSRGGYEETQLDSTGDVLVTGSFPIPPGRIRWGWWGNETTRVGQPLD